MKPEKPTYEQIKRRIERVKRQITKHPEQYDQATWCGSAQCVAGWLAHFATKANKAAAGDQTFTWEIAQLELGELKDPWIFSACMGDHHGKFHLGCAEIEGKSPAEIAALACAALDQYLAERKAEFDQEA